MKIVRLYETTTDVLSIGGMIACSFLDLLEVSIIVIEKITTQGDAAHIERLLLTRSLLDRTTVHTKTSVLTKDANLDPKIASVITPS